MSKSAALKVTDINTKPVNTPPDAAGEPAPETSVEQDKRELAKLLREQRIEELKTNIKGKAEYAAKHPIKTAGIVTTVGFSIYGAYRLIRDITG